MLATCAWLNLLVRQHKDVGLACLAQSVNVVCLPVIVKMQADRVAADLAGDDETGWDPLPGHLLSVRFSREHRYSTV